MSVNFTTIKSITDNLQSVLQAQGIKFTRKTFEDEKAIPASLLPLGEIYYRGEDFEYNHGQRAGYSEANFDIKVTVQDRDMTALMRLAQKWTHAVRDALTVNALNIGDLSASKLVSWVVMESVGIGYNVEYATLTHAMKIRYRET